MAKEELPLPAYGDWICAIDWTPGTEHKIQKSILLDRPRLLHLLQDSYELLSDLPYYGFVNDILVERDDLF